MGRRKHKKKPDPDPEPVEETMLPSQTRSNVARERSSRKQKSRPKPDPTQPSTSQIETDPVSSDAETQPGSKPSDVQTRPETAPETSTVSQRTPHSTQTQSTTPKSKPREESYPYTVTKERCRGQSKSTVKDSSNVEHKGLSISSSSSSMNPSETSTPLPLVSSSIDNNLPSSSTDINSSVNTQSSVRSFKQTQKKDQSSYYQSSKAPVQILKSLKEDEKQSVRTPIKTERSNIESKKMKQNVKTLPTEKLNIESDKDKVLNVKILARTEKTTESIKDTNVETIVEPKSPKKTKQKVKTLAQTEKSTCESIKESKLNAKTTLTEKSVQPIVPKLNVKDRTEKLNIESIEVTQENVNISAETEKMTIETIDKTNRDVHPEKSQRRCMIPTVSDIQPEKSLQTSCITASTTSEVQPKSSHRRCIIPSTSEIKSEKSTQKRCIIRTPSPSAQTDLPSTSDSKSITSNQKQYGQKIPDRSNPIPRYQPTKNYKATKLSQNLTLPPAQTSKPVQDPKQQPSDIKITQNQKSISQNLESKPQNIQSDSRYASQPELQNWRHSDSNWRSTGTPKWRQPSSRYWRQSDLQNIRESSPQILKQPDAKTTKQPSSQKLTQTSCSKTTNQIQPLMAIPVSAPSRENPPQSNPVMTNQQQRSWELEQLKRWQDQQNRRTQQKIRELHQRTKPTDKPVEQTQQYPTPPQSEYQSASNIGVIRSQPQTFREYPTMIYRSSGSQYPYTSNVYPSSVYSSPETTHRTVTYYPTSHKRQSTTHNQPPYLVHGYERSSEETPSGQNPQQPGAETIQPYPGYYRTTSSSLEDKTQTVYHPMDMNRIPPGYTQQAVQSANIPYRPLSAPNYQSMSPSPVLYRAMSADIAQIPTEQTLISSLTYESRFVPSVFCQSPMVQTVNFSSSFVPSAVFKPTAESTGTESGFNFTQFVPSGTFQPTEQTSSFIRQSPANYNLSFEPVRIDNTMSRSCASSPRSSTTCYPTSSTSARDHSFSPEDSFYASSTRDRASPGSCSSEHSTKTYCPTPDLTNYQGLFQTPQHSLTSDTATGYEQSIGFNTLQSSQFRPSSRPINIQSSQLRATKQEPTIEYYRATYPDQSHPPTSYVKSGVQSLTKQSQSFTQYQVTTPTAQPTYQAQSLSSEFQQLEIFQPTPAFGTSPIHYPDQSSAFYQTGTPAFGTSPIHYPAQSSAFYQTGTPEPRSQPTHESQNYLPTGNQQSTSHQSTSEASSQSRPSSQFKAPPKAKYQSSARYQPTTPELLYYLDLPASERLRLLPNVYSQEIPSETAQNFDHLDRLYQHDPRMEPEECVALNDVTPYLVEIEKNRKFSGSRVLQHLANMEAEEQKENTGATDSSSEGAVGYSSSSSQGRRITKRRDGPTEVKELKNLLKKQFGL